MTKKKTTILIVLVIILVGGVVGISLQTQPSSGPITLTYWGLNQPISVIAPLIEEFEAANPDIKIEYQEQTITDYRERLQNALANNRGPDIFRIHNTWVPIFSRLLQPAPSDIITPQEFENIYYPVTKDWLSNSRQVIALPLMYDGLGLYINTPLLRGSGLSVPKTWEELTAAARALTIQVDDEILRGGVAMGTTNNVDYWSDIVGLLLLQNGADMSQPDSQEALDAIMFYQQFTTRDMLWSEALPSSIYAFATEKVAMMFAPSSAAQLIYQQNPNLIFEVVPPPGIPQTTVNWASFWVEAVSAKASSRQQIAAWKFLHHLSTKESLRQRYELTIKTPGVIVGEIFPRVDMRDQLSENRYAGAYVKSAPTARSWFLSSNTQDNALNDQIIDLYQNAIDSNRPQLELSKAAKEIQLVLAPYSN